ncbi:MAG: tRNA pseudouridine(38-40) synthase TruA [Caulobacteraceae bacterium]
MPRYRLTLEYDGAPYKGFQMQADLPSVQGALQTAIEAFCGERPVIHAAGRTDTGVHATGQVCHIDLEKAWPERTVREALNAHLAREAVTVLAAAEVSADFHARFSAKGRRYLYRILNRRAPPALDKGRVWHVRKPLDAEAMHTAAQALVGQHDFTTFRDAACQAKSPVKTLDEARVWTEGEEVRLAFAARSFLHRQVRSMTGSLAEVGAGRWSIDDFRAALHAAERKACGPVAPPEGLYLTHVEY